MLPAYTADEISPALPAKEVTKIALRLKYQIEQVIPYELQQSLITNPNSTVITKNVIRTAKEAGGEEYRACVLFCLLVCQKWFHTEGLHALWDSPLCDCRALACQVIAKKLSVQLIFRMPMPCFKLTNPLRFMSELSPKRIRNGSTKKPY